ncbi:N-succinylarginine dihydrolase [Planctomicrobium sp. SH664]|uniref:N-succinylarginine dihydrolase n=1 Tax=Planctomicrobium sp. SH664 TaxID=3448125 RepID=UPI003F5BDC45
MNWQEVNFDGLVGPTHHYGGLGLGNLASQANRHAISHPRQAALEGLAKMKLLAENGIKQAILPPHPRPHWGVLREAGLAGSPAQIIEQAAREHPALLSIAYSSAFMWTANAATVSPSPDTADGKVHLTPANLVSTAHRRLEAPFVTRLLREIFNDSRFFAVHDPLPPEARLADEGAANHLRLSSPSSSAVDRHGTPSVEVFVYGRDAESEGQARPARFEARQTLQASQQVARQHRLSDIRTLFVQQNPVAIDAGCFHNDVIAVSNENVLLCHERAFLHQDQVLSELRNRVPGLQILEVAEAEVSLAEAVRTYLFNSQLVSLPAGGMLLLCPAACSTSPSVQRVVERWLAGDNPIREFRTVDVQQSLRNGGGPACLRLRVVLNDLQLGTVNPRLFLNDALYDDLCAWVERHYRAELSIDDLADPQLADEVAAALTDLAQLLQLPSTFFTH